MADDDTEDDVNTNSSERFTISSAWTRELVDNNNNNDNNETRLHEDDWPRPDQEDPDFFGIYFSNARFASETAVAAASAVLNLAALVALANRRDLARPTKAVYRCLFANLTLANCLISVVQWFCNNILYFFDDPLMAMLDQGRYCSFVVYLTAAFFVATSFGMVSALTMLGFSAHQYFAICKPLRSIAVVSTARVTGFLVVSWVVSFLCCCLPFVVLLLVAEYATDCDESLLKIIQHSIVIGVNVSVSAVGAIYLVVIVVCLRIYLEVRRLQRRLLQFSIDQNLKHERKAFVTTVILLATLTFFFLPHTVIFAFTFNGATDHLLHSAPLVHYMNLLPYVKFLTDPLIYGLRMRRPTGSAAAGGDRRAAGCCGGRLFGGRSCSGRRGGGGGGRRGDGARRRERRRSSWHFGREEQGSSSNEVSSATASYNLSFYRRRRSAASRRASVYTMTTTTTTCGMVAQVQVNEADDVVVVGKNKTPISV